MIGDTSRSTFLFPFPITTVPLILCYSRFIVNTLTGVFIKHGSEPWSVLWHYTGLFVNWRTVRVPVRIYLQCQCGRAKKVERSVAVSRKKLTKPAKAYSTTIMMKEVFIFNLTCFHSSSSVPSSVCGFLIFL